MKFDSKLIWSAVNGRLHPTLSNHHKTIDGMKPLIQTLFPGIECRSAPKFFAVFNYYAVPALKSLFPEYINMHEDDIDNDDVEVTEILECHGYQHQDDSQWKQDFHNKIQQLVWILDHNLVCMYEIFLCFRY